MKIIDLNNAVEVQDIDLNDDPACIELGNILADKSVVFIDQSVTEQRLFDITACGERRVRQFCTVMVGSSV